MNAEDFVRESTRKPTAPLGTVDPDFVKLEPWKSVDAVLPIPSIPSSLAEKIQRRLAKRS
jgi:hypothetical protein